MAKTTDDSVHFSLQELLKLEQDRVQEEQAAKVRAETEAQRHPDDEGDRDYRQQIQRAPLLPWIGRVTGGFVLIGIGQVW